MTPSAYTSGSHRCPRSPRQIIWTLLRLAAGALLARAQSALRSPHDVVYGPITTVMHDTSTPSPAPITFGSRLPAPSASCTSSAAAMSTASSRSTPALAFNYMLPPLSSSPCRNGLCCLSFAQLLPPYPPLRLNSSPSRRHTSCHRVCTFTFQQRIPDFPSPYASTPPPPPLRLQLLSMKPWIRHP